MNNISTLLDLAHDHFLSPHGDQLTTFDQSHYIDLISKLSPDCLHYSRDHEDYGDLYSPALYLSQVSRNTLADRWEQPLLQRPSFSVVAGAYGVGKTSLLGEVAARLRSAHRQDLAMPHGLPIKLGSCARQLHSLLTADSDVEFLRHLLSHLARDVDTDLLRDLLQRIRHGSLVLILDAVDELVSDHLQHRDLHLKLGQFLGTRAPQAHIILSVRLEHLRRVDGEREHCGRTTSQALRRSGMPVNFLLLDFFDHGALRDYVESRLHERGETISRQLEALPRLQQVLRRPLLARIFCDLVQGSSTNDHRAEAFRQAAIDVQTPAELVQLFVRRATTDKNILRAQRELDISDLMQHEGTYWDPVALAAQTLKAYRLFRNHLDYLDVCRVLGVPESTDAVHLARLVHKCPFLLAEVSTIEESPSSAVPEGVECLTVEARFSHRIFYEYFVAQGIVDELAQLRPPEMPSGRIPGFLSFHDLVLNIDTHRFLRMLTISRAGGEDDGERWWYEETGVAYGLTEESEAEWEPPLSAHERQNLDRLRCVLLDVRSGVRHKLTKEEISNVIDQLLSIDEGSDGDSADQTGRALTPRFLVPNYEAIAVCIEDPVLYRTYADRFSALLARRLEQARVRLGIEGRNMMRQPYELLVERIFDIGKRFSFPWIFRWDSESIVADISRISTRTIYIRNESGGYTRTRAILDDVDRTAAH